MPATEIVNTVDADLYDRAIHLLDELLAELENLDKVEMPVELPRDLREAWIEHQALAETMKTLAEKGGPNVREELKELYRTKLDEADEYGDEFDNIQGPEVNKELVEKVETLLEEDRRARLLA